jgi:S-formylglutathione hydrolase FrmB
MSFIPTRAGSAGVGFLAACALAVTAGTAVHSQAPAPRAPGAAGAQAPVALKGTLERIKVHGRSLEGNLMGESAEPEVSIYLPPSYQRERTRRYPVVYLLHGYTNSDLGYFGPEGRGLHLIAERVFGNGAAKEMILVMPNCMNAYGGCMYSNSVTAGNWEGYVAEDLVAYMDSHYRTIGTRESRGLGGHSMGGYGTLRIAMKRPDVFGAIYALSSCCLNECTVRPPRRARWRGRRPGRPTRRIPRSSSTCPRRAGRCSQRWPSSGPPTHRWRCSISTCRA